MPINPAFPPIPVGTTHLLLTSSAGAAKSRHVGIGGLLRQIATGETTNFSEEAIAATQNEAGYQSLIRGLRLAKERLTAADSLMVCADERTVIYQIIDLWRAQSSLRPFYQQTKEVINSLPFPVDFFLVSRTANQEAHQLAKQALVSEKNEKMTRWTPDPTFQVDRAKLQCLMPLDPNCQTGIERMLTSPAPDFFDFAALKSGMDPYSHMKIEGLEEAVITRFGQTTWAWLIGRFGTFPSDYGLRVMRWTARGLRPDLAMKKVSVDRDVATKARKKNSESHS